MTVPNDLDVGDFEQFLRDVYGADNPSFRAFPWQRRLLDDVMGSGRWPDLIDLPTGSGKTACLDVAVFLMALRRDTPRRVIFVVDRRVIVHQAARRAKTLMRALWNPATAVVWAVADRLSARCARWPVLKPPLAVAELRGGIVRDETWAMRPDAPAVIVSTVDQVGSRLFFGGYGVSDSMRPVHAGLLGNDALFLLDEVHLSRPFADTLRTVADRYHGVAQQPLPLRWQVVELSATPSRTDGNSVFALEDASDLDPEGSPVLHRRVTARKPARTLLVRSGVDAHTRRQAVAQAAATEACRLLTEVPGRRIAVMVNRVETAHLAYGGLAEQAVAACYLLTGRMRPLDRDHLLQQLGSSLDTGRTRGADDAPMVVVATQTLEAGADFDFDAIVSECAAIDALRQRFGRVDRDGVLSAAHRSARSVIVAATPDVAADAEDPVYGRALARSWSWLAKQEALDFGLDAMRRTLPTDLSDLLAPTPPVPVLLRTHLDRWVQTSPAPDAEPDVAPWLHGLDRLAESDVTVVWRGDLSRELLEERDLATTVVSACPPVSAEGMQVPLPAVRQWLVRVADHRSQNGQVAVADIEGVAYDVDEVVDDVIAPALRWRGDESLVARRGTDLRPGDTLVVPADYGGVRSGNWDPTSSRPVSDLALEAQRDYRGRIVLRLHSALLPQLDTADALSEPPTPSLEDDEPDRERTLLRDWLTEFATHLDGNDSQRDLFTAVQRLSTQPFTVQRVPLAPDLATTMFVLSAPSDPGRPPTGMVDTEPATSAFAGRAVGLEHHLRDVSRAARDMAHACGLAAELVEDLSLAAMLHDVGKADPRFQRMLRYASRASQRVAVAEQASPQLLAKSGLSGDDRVARRQAAIAAGYPHLARHELLSVSLIENCTDLRSRAHDWDLVLHLVASHHGYARPFVPVGAATRPEPVEVSIDGITMSGHTDHKLERLDSGIPDRFWRLVRRYGWWGLAMLEAVVRLADHRASAKPSRVEDAENG